MDKILSVIIPSYNMEMYLPKCISSLIVDDQNLLNKLEVVVVNDGSKDATLQLAQKFEQAFPNVVRVINKPNGNYGSCINMALKVVRGRFVKILDADDSFDTALFCKYLYALVDMPRDVDMVMNNYRCVDSGGNTTREVTYPYPVGISFTLKDIITSGCDMAMHAVAYRTDMLRKIAYSQLEGISYTDTEWFYLPAAASKCVRFLGLPIYKYLVGREGQTVESSTYVKNLWMLEKIFDRMLEQYDDKGVRSYASVPYLEFQLKRLVWIFLYMHVHNVPGGKSAYFFRHLSFLFSRYPFLKTVQDQYCLFKRTPLRISYVGVMVAHPGWSSVIKKMVLWYMSMRRK